MVVQPTPAPVPLDPRGYNCWQARDAANPTCIDSTTAKVLSGTLVLRRYGQTFGFVQWMWKGVIYATDPSLPAPGVVIHDTTVVFKRDTVIVIRVDTVKVPTPTPTPTPNTPHAPELPRGMAAMDSMIDSARAIDTMNTASWPHIKQDSTGKWVCYLNCTPAAQARVKTMNAPKPKAAPKKMPVFTKPIIGA